METINEMCELTPPCECNCNPDKDLSQGNIRPNYSPSPCGADGGVCGEHILEHPLHLWAIKYGVEGHLKFIGVAVVQAPTRSAAECIFAKNSLFSGTPERLKILAMKEVMPWSEPILFEDCAAIIDRHNLKSYPFLLKSDYEHNIQNISDTVIEAVEDYIEHNPFQQVNSDWNETDESSKAYILNKPEIPDAQVQSNWNETDTNSKAYILNKPEIPDAQIQSDWSENNTSSKAFILNKPTDLVHTSDIEGLLKNDGTVYTGKYLEQVRDLDNFQASEGKIVQYIGETNAKYTNSFNYRKVGVRRVIQPGTRYIEINDSTGELLKVGVPNGKYYKIDEYEEIVWHIQRLGNPKVGEIPVKTDENGFMITNIGSYAIVNNRFLKITNVRNLDSNGHLKYGYRYGSGLNSIIGFEDNTEIELDNSGQGNENPIIQNNLSVYENQNGIRIYQWYPGYIDLVLIIEDWGDAKRAISFSTFIISSTTEEVIIDTTEWQQCIPPEEDTSHYVTDSEIGWIEH